MSTVPFHIYSHADTDGAIAALVLKAHLDRLYGDSLEIRTEPVDHGSAGGRPWASRTLRAPFAVLDFTLHPTMLLTRSYDSLRSLPHRLRGLSCYWIDHHATGGAFPFLREDNLGEFLPSFLKAVWDTSAKSTPGLMRKHRTVLELSQEVLEEYECLIDWAEIIDGALFESAAAALNSNDPVVKLDLLFSTRHEVIRRSSLYGKLIDDLLRFGQDFPLAILDRDPLYQAVIDYESLQFSKRRAAYEQVIEEKAQGLVVVCDFRKRPDLWEGMSRFEPYALAPSCQYAVHVAPQGEGWEHCPITCGQNPWNPPRQGVSLGDEFALHFRGGGHRFVAGGVIAPQDEESLEALVSRLAQGMLQG